MKFFPVKLVFMVVLLFCSFALFAEVITTGAGTRFVYAASYATQSVDDDIGQFVLGTFSNPATAPTPLINNPAATGTYTDYTAMTINVVMDHIYPVSILQFNSANMYSCQAAVYIDFNQNGTFDLPDEQVFLGATSTTGPINPVTGSLTIPYGNIGVTRLRVVLKEGTSGIAPTGTYTWGETEDYTINIGYGPPPPPWIELLTPNMEGDVGLNPTFSWQIHYYIKEPITYKISIGTDNPPTDVLSSLDVGSVTSYALGLGHLDYGMTYYWQIKAYADGELFLASEIEHFDTVTDPTITVFPYSQGFEDGYISNWTFNQWTLTHGSHTGTYGARALYAPAGTKILTSPPIVTSNTLWISWWWKNNDMPSKIASHDTTYAEITYDGGLTWETMATLSAASPETGYHQAYWGIQYASRGTVQLRWRYVTDGTSSAYGVGLDDIYITETSPPPPTHHDLVLPVTPIGGSSSDIITIGNVGPGTLTGTVSYSAGLSGPTSFTQLDPESMNVEVTYTPTEQGYFTGTVYFISNMGDFTSTVTSNAGITAVDWETMPTGWSVYDLDGDAYQWAWYTGTPHTGTYAVGCRYHNAGYNNDWLISPCFQINAGDKLTFYAMSMDAEYPEALKVMISSTGNAPAEFTMTLLDVPAVPDIYTGYSIDLSAYAGTDSYIAFYDYSFDSWYLMVDDIGLPGLAAVAAPTDLTATPSGSAVQLNWTAVPHASSYRVYAAMDPLAPPELWTLLAETTTKSYLDTVASDVKFYKIIAVNGSRNSNDIHALSNQSAVSVLERSKK